MRGSERQNSPTFTSRRSIMNGLIVFLSVFGVALAQYGAHPAGPQETPEVAAARAAHLNALAAAGGHVPAPAAPSWNANPGVPQDTPEVAAAKAAHFAALAQAGSPAPQANAYNPAPQQYNQPNSYNNNYAPRWNGPLALPPGFDSSGAPLPVQDTPEVQAERAHHLALAARAGAPAPLGAPSWNQGAAQSWNQPAAPSWNQAAAPSWNQAAAPSWNQAAAPSWNQPAAPAYGGYGAPQGAPADTPEVAAAKAAHFAAHQAAIGHRYRRSVLLAAPLAHPVAVAPIAVAHAAPLAIAHAPVLRHTILI